MVRTYYLKLYGTMSRRTLLIKFIFSVAIMAILVLQVDKSQLRLMAENIHPVTWGYALVFIFLQIGALSARWMLLVNAENPKPMRFTTSVRITAVSFLANYVFITSLGGIVARIGLTMSHGFSFMKSLAATLIDRGMTLLALLILAALFMPFLHGIFYPQLLNASTVFVTLMLVGVATIMLSIVYRNRRAIIFSHRRVAICYKYARALLTDTERMAKIVGISLVGQIFYFAAVYIVMSSLGTDFSFIRFLAVIPIITLIASLPVGYGGWGIREGAFMYGLGLINMPLEAAFMASVQIGILTTIAAMISGIPALIDDETQDALQQWRQKKPRPVHVRN